MSKKMPLKVQWVVLSMLRELWSRSQSEPLSKRVETSDDVFVLSGSGELSNSVIFIRVRKVN